MSFAAAERLAHTLLYEGYVLYPYRRSSLKNQQRWPLGALYPAAFCALGHGDPCAMQTECVVSGSAASVRGCVRFLQLLPRIDGDGEREGGPWHEAVERRIELPETELAELVRCALEIDVELEGANAAAEPLRARVIVSALQTREAVYRLRVAIENRSTCAAPRERNAVLPWVLASTHTLLACQGGRFVSLLEPPDALQAETAVCVNVGCFPVLIGEAADADAGARADAVMLSSPIILYDHPGIAAESNGDFFDATEIDEMLTLRVLTLSEQERAEAMRTDPRARQLLERTSALDGAAILELHGARRAPDMLTAGSKVRIKPRRGGDVLDLALAGELATIAKIEQDLEGRMYYAVTVDCDPGRDLGLQGQPGHRFFFHRDELEPAP